MHTPARHPLLKFRLSLMMFLQFVVWGAFFVSMAKYLLTAFDGTEGLNTIIANAYKTQPIGAMIAPLFIGLIADRFFPAQIVNGILHLTGAGLLWYVAGTADPGAFVWGMLAFFIAYMPTLALVNVIAFNAVGNTEKEFPAIRVWGTIGWIVAGVVVAQSFFGLFELPIWGVDDAGKTAIQFKLGAVVSLIYGLYSFTLPHTPPRAKQQKVSLRKMIGLDALGLLRQRSFLVFAICSFLTCIPLAFYYSRTNDFIAAMGVQATEAKMALGQMSEIVFMVLVPVFLVRLGVKWMLLAGMLAWIARYALFAFFPATEAMLLLGILLHGICYDFFFVTGQLYVDRKAPKDIRASAQAFVSFITLGAGMYVGNEVLGWWSEKRVVLANTPEDWLVKAQAFWLFPCGLAVVGAVIFFLFFKDRETDAAIRKDAAGAGDGDGENQRGGASDHARIPGD